MDSELLYYIKKALEYYDNIKEKYKINNIKKKKVDITPVQHKIFINNETYTYELLGIFDTNTSVFTWAFSLPIIDDNFKKESESLHLYGLKQKVIKGNKDSNYDHETLKESISLQSFYIKTIFGNSRLLINNSLELEIILALSSYFLKDRIKFIYNYEEYGLIQYFLIK